MKQIHVLEVAKSTAGVGEYIKWIANGLDREAFKLTIMCLSEGSTELAFELNKITGVNAYSMGMDRYKINLFSDSQVLIGLRRLIGNQKFDLIHAHASKPGFITRLAAFGTGIPVIYSPHCFPFHPGIGRFKAKLLAILERSAARYLTTHIITVSNAERDLALRYQIDRKDKFTTIYSGVKMKQFNTPIDRPAIRKSLGVSKETILIGTVGRLSKQKGVNDFIESAEIIHTERPDTRFIWVGDGPLESMARNTVKSKGLSHIFYFMGQRKDVPNILRVMNCFVLSSHWEGFSLAILEAMAAGLPIVATRVTGADEAIVEGENGFLVAPKDPTAIGRAVLKIINNRDLALQFGTFGRQRVEKYFNRTNMISQLLQLYQHTYKSYQKKTVKCKNIKK